MAKPFVKQSEVSAQRLLDELRDNPFIAFVIDEKNNIVRFFWSSDTEPSIAQLRIMIEQLQTLAKKREKINAHPSKHQEQATVIIGSFGQDLSRTER